MVSDDFTCAGRVMKRLWHCFGNDGNRISIEVVQELLHISQTNVLPINTHSLMHRDDRFGLLIGYGDVTYDALCNAIDVTSYIRMLNINLATDPGEAVDRARRAYRMTGEQVLKLEVLGANRTTSNDESLIEAVAALNEGPERFVIMPLVSTNVAAAQALIALGCPLLRVMGSGIGSGAGIADVVAFRRICELGVPVVLDGGVGSSGDYRAALDYGADGALINSMLFASDAPPGEVMREFVSAIRTSRYSKAS